MQLQSMRPTNGLGGLGCIKGLKILDNLNPDYELRFSCPNKLCMFKGENIFGQLKSVSLS